MSFLDSFNTSQLKQTSPFGQTVHTSSPMSRMILQQSQSQNVVSKTPETEAIAKQMRETTELEKQLVQVQQKIQKQRQEIPIKIQAHVQTKFSLINDENLKYVLDTIVGLASNLSNFSPTKVAQTAFAKNLTVVDNELFANLKTGLLEVMSSDDHERNIQQKQFIEESIRLSNELEILLNESKQLAVERDQAFKHSPEQFQISRIYIERLTKMNQLMEDYQKRNSTLHSNLTQQYQQLNKINSTKYRAAMDLIMNFFERMSDDEIIIEKQISDIMNETDLLQFFKESDRLYAAVVVDFAIIRHYQESLVDYNSFISQYLQSFARGEVDLSTLLQFNNGLRQILTHLAGERKDDSGLIEKLKEQIDETETRQKILAKGLSQLLEKLQALNTIGGRVQNLVQHAAEIFNLQREKVQNQTLFNIGSTNLAGIDGQVAIATELDRPHILSLKEALLQSNTDLKRKLDTIVGLFNQKSEVFVAETAAFTSILSYVEVFELLRLSNVQHQEALTVIIVMKLLNVCREFSI